MKPPLSPRLGPLMRITRLEKSVSLKTLAQRAKTTEDWLRGVESGAEMVQFSTVILYASALKVDPGPWIREVSEPGYEQLADEADDYAAIVRGIVWQKSTRQA